MNICVVNPADLSNEKLLAAAKLVKTGGALVAEIDQLKARLLRSYKLTVYCEGAVVLAVASLKRPDTNYRNGVFEKAGVEIDGFGAAAELGYVTVDDSMRGKGLARRLVAPLMKKRGGPYYATTDLCAMKTILSRAGFAQQGSEWEGQRGLLSLWTIES